MALRCLAPILACGLSVHAATAPAADFPPASNAAALAGPFALPATGATSVAATRQQQLGASLDFINEWESLGFDAAGNCAADECVSLDAETYRLSLRYRRGLAPGLEWTAELPVLAQSRGFLDDSIETWHHWFDLPNNGRERQPRNRFGVRYLREGETVLAVDEPSTGAGDLRLGLGLELGRGVLRAQLKLPTGDERSLREGNAGAALWYDFALAETRRWRSYLSAGASLNQRGDVLPAQQNTFVPFGAAGLRLSLTQRFHLHSQLYLHGRLYHDTELRNLYRYGAVLGFGARYDVTPSWSLDVGMLEDADVNVSPDFDVQVAVTWNAVAHPKRPRTTRAPLVAVQPGWPAQVHPRDAPDPGAY